MENHFKRRRAHLFLILLFSVSGYLLSAQEPQLEASYLQWFDQQVGIENTALYDGIIYRESFRTINDNVKFFKTAQWLTGSVVYAGQKFSEIPMKYDVFGDQLIIKQEDRLGGGALLLFKDKVEKFNLLDSEFVNIKNIPAETGLVGFFELLWQNGKMRLLAKLQKDDFLRKDRASVYYEFINSKKIHVLELEGKYYILKNKKDVVAIFPDLKKQIDAFFQKNKRLRSRDTDAFMISLINSIESIINQDQPTPSR